MCGIHWPKCCAQVNLTCWLSYWLLHRAQVSRYDREVVSPVWTIHFWDRILAISQAKCPFWECPKGSSNMGTEKILLDDVPLEKYIFWNIHDNRWLSNCHVWLPESSGVVWQIRRKMEQKRTLHRSPRQQQQWVRSWQGESSDLNSATTWGPLDS